MAKRKKKKGKPGPKEERLILDDPKTVLDELLKKPRRKRDKNRKDED